MTVEQLASEIAKGLINTGVEGPFDALSCSTAGDYPSVGVSQWEGPRCDDLLGRIPGGDHFQGRSYSDIENAGELQALKDLLGSDAGQAAQQQKLAEDCQNYVNSLQEIQSMDQSRPMIYAGMWCPTSDSVVKAFLQRREERGYNLRDLSVMRDMFYNEYANAAGCEDYAAGYQNRATATYDYVANLDLSQYGE
ncbi:hypothetical protein AB840_14655 [Megasphaera cerevisiae DSM 20462]|uniref:Uncharacterized protein n=1 Tax=Megasphaera cerevisiae DSM 20462 TaxID=1122219 RepID=A0A0J6WRV6_9FIRM|nr:hypothetical protein [Megasphaera cerevisiae]KMO85244.1 hypothetical protein AB840_14655 [Megasphaera cerevisiae DSM 20462]SKA25534.1 hypothetical protein SAMN05660900_03048 [Megasphaera cerevisiae DSM 20462]